MILFFFGADDTWQKLQTTGFYRRNTCLLKAFSEDDRIKHVFLVHRTIRPKLLKHIKRIKSGNKVWDVFFATILPDKRLFFLLNRWMIRWQLYLQTGYRPKGKDLLFVYWPKGYLAWKATGYKGMMIFDTDHHMIDDPHLDKDQKLTRINLMKDIFQNSDWIISSTRSMLAWIREQGFDRIQRVRNGVDLSRFNRSPSRENSIAGPPVIGYVGTLSRWVDWELLLKLVGENPSWSFHFIGKPYKSKEYENLMTFPNVELYGHQAPEEVASLIQGFDVGLVLYRKHPGLDVDSMKIYEYLAAGIPVVSTRFHDHLEEDFNGLLYLGEGLDGLEREIRNALKKGESGEKERREFLKASSWAKRAEEVIRLG